MEVNLQRNAFWVILIGIEEDSGQEMMKTPIRRKNMTVMWKMMWMMIRKLTKKVEDGELVQGCKQGLPAAAASLAQRKYLPRKTDFEHFAIGVFAATILFLPTSIIVE